MFRIYPYKIGSASVRKLKAQLGGLLIRLEGSRYRPRKEHVIINWGNSRRPDWMTAEVDPLVLNKPESVKIATDKLKTLEELNDAGVSCVDFTDDINDARNWLAAGDKVFARATLTGHSGEGITVHEPTGDQGFLARIAARLKDRGFDNLGNIVQDEADDIVDDLPNVPLYTRGVSNSGEYRVHVVKNNVILYQKKSRRVNEDGEVETAEGADADVRNLASNWVYRTGNLRRLERVENLAIDAIKAVGLDFGAVDIIMDNNGDVYVLEVNSAPGLGNTDTLEAYTDAFNTL